MTTSQRYDAVVVLSFGGPEGPDDVMPFLEKVTRGRNVPRERLQRVAAQYERFGGVSPINAQNRALIAALKKQLAAHGPRLPVYFGNRNWRPFLADTVARMADDGIQKALAFVTSAYSSYSGCRQYLEDIERARAQVGSRAPIIHKLRAFWNHPGFIEPMVARVEQAITRVPAERRPQIHVLFTAHSIPERMAETSDYVLQLQDAMTLVAERLGRRLPCTLVYQSRSGLPTQPWLEPDVVDYLATLKARGVMNVVVVPIGFIHDHMEVLYDLDTKARERAEQLGLNMIRAATVGTEPAFVSMIRELILERLGEQPIRRALGTLGPRRDFCPPDCCPKQD
jgi:ferrochelatase